MPLCSNSIGASQEATKCFHKSWHDGWLPGSMQRFLEANFSLTTLARHANWVGHSAPASNAGGNNNNNATDYLFLIFYQVPMVSFYDTNHKTGSPLNTFAQSLFYSCLLFPFFFLFVCPHVLLFLFFLLF